MKLSFKSSLLISMILLGVGYGLIYHFILMPLIRNTNGLIGCIIQGLIFSLINYLMSIGIYEKYHILQNSNRILKEDLKIDKLTGLLNRRAFDEDICKLNLHENYSIIFIDIDNFREFNNKFGHQTGDSVLQKVCYKIKDSVRTSDNVYRYGGEEAVILLKNCNKNRALEVAEKVRLNINKLDNNPYPTITISLGVASYPEDGAEVEDIIKSSDNALLMAKGLGKNQVFDFYTLSP